jgi:hypothetical protein
MNESEPTTLQQMLPHDTPTAAGAQVPAPDPFTLEPPRPVMKPRGFPYVWTTWLAGLLSGDQQCRWRVWVRVHYREYEKIPDPDQSNLDKWKAEHNALLQARVNALRAAESMARVTIEGQNEFKIKGAYALLSGKPDIIVHGNGTERVEDIKGGDPRASDFWQVCIYGMDRVLRAAAEERECIVSGAVVYRNHQQAVTPADIANARPRIGAEMRALATGPEPGRVPSEFECGRCDIACCPDRAKPIAPTPTEDF